MPFFGANLRRIRGSLYFALNHQYPLGIVRGLCTVMLDPALIVVAELIKPYAVLFRVHEFLEAAFQLQRLSVVNDTFKNAVLHTLSVVDTELRNFSQSFSPGGFFGVDIICY